MKKIFLYLFLIVSLGEIVSILFSLESVHFVCKPLIVVTLFAFYHFSVDREHRSRALLLAMIFSFVGDVLLMLQSAGESNFMLGLFAFLIAHVFYMLAYRQHKVQDSIHGLQGVQRIRFAFPIILAGTGLIVVLYPVLGNLKFPVILYALVLMVMVISALFRYGYTNTKSFWLVFAGAFLFMVSDATLAINRFFQPVQHGTLIIMVSYMAAQYFIVTGLLHHSKK